MSLTYCVDNIVTSRPRIVPERVRNEQQRVLCVGRYSGCLLRNRSGWVRGVAWRVQCAAPHTLSYAARRTVCNGVCIVRFFRFITPREKFFFF